MASELAPEVTHAIGRPDDVATFGWDPTPEVTEADALMTGYWCLRFARRQCQNSVACNTQAIGTALGV